MSDPCQHPRLLNENRGTSLMLAELNHRVGNELTAALAALRLVQRSLGDRPEPTGFLEQAVLRLEHFGELHHILDSNRSAGSLNERLETLCRAISVAKAAPRGVHIAFRADDVLVDDAIAWTVCVVVSELLTNVLKHAFGDDGDGLVVVELRDEQEMIVLSVADNGVGLRPVVSPPRESVEQRQGAGWGIVTELTERVGGAIHRHSRLTGTTVTVEVPARVLTV